MGPGSGGLPVTSVPEARPCLRQALSQSPRPCAQTSPDAPFPPADLTVRGYHGAWHGCAETGILVSGTATWSLSRATESVSGCGCREGAQRQPAREGCPGPRPHLPAQDPRAQRSVPSGSGSSASPPPAGSGVVSPAGPPRPRPGRVSHVLGGHDAPHTRGRSRPTTCPPPGRLLRVLAGARGEPVGRTPSSHSRRAERSVGKLAPESSPRELHNPPTPDSSGEDATDPPRRLGPRAGGKRPSVPAARRGQPRGAPDPWQVRP